MDEKKNNKQEKTKRITKKVNEDIKEIKILDEDIKTTDKEDKKNKFNTVEVIAIMIITTLFGGFIGSAVTFFKDNKTVGVGNKDLQELISTYYEVVDNYYGDINSEELLESGIKGMINYLDDPYSSYLDPTYSASFNEQLEGEYTGLGAEITNNEEGNAIVKTIFKDSPAEKIGLKVDDVIYKVNNTLVKDITLEELVTMIKSDSEDEVNLYVTRNKENLELKFVRGNVELTSVTSKTIEKNGQIIGLIDISIFAKNSYEQFKRAYEELEKDGITSLIVDVRNNNGGYLATAKSISELFLQKKDIIFIIEDHNGKTNQTSSQNGIIKVPVVLLIDGSTASASEVLAAALQENLDIELIGTTTYGKGSVQKTKQLSSGATIKYTTEKWLTPSGKSIDGHGIEPTIKVEQSKKYFENPIDENDEQLQKAIEILTNNK